MLKVADGWWNLSVKYKEEQLQARAAMWYAKALPQLVDIDRLRASKRLEEVQEV